MIKGAITGSLMLSFLLTDKRFPDLKHLHDLVFYFVTPPVTLCDNLVSITTHESHVNIRFCMDLFSTETLPIHTFLISTLEIDKEV